MADFGPSGFTMQPSIADVLLPHVLSESDGMRRWEGLAAEEGRRLLEQLPQELQEDQHQSAPSLADAVGFIERYGGTLSGYWILPPRPDERISLDGMVVPLEAAGEIDSDETAEEREEVGGGMIRLWWD